MVNAGAIVPESLNQFEDYTKAFTMLYDRVPKGCRVAVISNAGFECSAAMDALFDLKLASLTEETKKKLADCLPGIAHADNPVDATPMAGTGQFVRAFAILLDDPGVDAVVVSPVPDTQALDTLRPDLTGTHIENIYAMDSLPAMLRMTFEDSDKPIIAAVDSGRLYDEFVILLERAGIPVYRKIDRATRALSLYCSTRVPCK
jgi:acyl-CoA synthetase (NDP forming)